MVNYQLGKIYCLTNMVTGSIYVGSSSQPSLSKRLAMHRLNATDLSFSSSLYEAMRLHGRDNFTMALHHAFPCNSKLELETEEYKTLDAIKAAGIHTYNMITAGKQALETKQKIAATKIAQNRVGNRNASFNYGCISFQKSTNSWIFSRQQNKKTVKTYFSVKRNGYWQAKLLAEAERKRVYPEWQSDEEKTLNEFGAMDLS